MQQDRPPAAGLSDEPVPEVEAHEGEALVDAAGDALASVVHVYTRLDVPAESGASSAEAHTASKRSGGTGIIIDPNGVILTNEHVIRDAMEPWIVTADGSWYLVTDVTVDGELDLAVLRIEASGLSAVTPAAARGEVGEPVVAIGCTGPDESASLRSGRITDMAASLQSQLDPAAERKYDDLIASSVALSPGFSGGPLLDAAGRLIGLNVAVSSIGGRSQGYAIAFDQRTRAALARLAGTPVGGDGE